MERDFKRSRGIFKCSLLVAAFLALVIASLAVQSAKAGDSSNPPTESSQSPIRCGAVREHDQIWLISTRGLGCPNGTEPALQVWLYDGAGGWTASSVQAFLATDNSTVPTDFYVHGNLETVDTAAERGLAVYGRLAAQPPASQPMRFVIWSWPTDPGKHFLRLARMHAHRADVDAYYLAWLVNRIDHRVPVGLVGYSFAPASSRGHCTCSAAVS